MSGASGVAVGPIADAVSSDAAGGASNGHGASNVTNTTTNPDGTVVTTVTGPTGAVVSTTTTNPTTTTTLNADGSATTTVVAFTGTIVSAVTVASDGGAPGALGKGAHDGMDAGSLGSMGLMDISA